jgi:hypothetical protein
MPTANHKLTSQEMARFVADGFLRFDALIPDAINESIIEELRLLESNKIKKIFGQPTDENGPPQPASWVAMFTQRWMHLTGVTRDALFEVAHTTRNYAVNNPNAFFYQRPFDRAEYDAARMICDPLQLFDCCQESDGASCVIVTTPERARPEATRRVSARRRAGGCARPGTDDVVLPQGVRRDSGNGDRREELLRDERTRPR